MASPAAVLSILVKANTRDATVGLARVNQQLEATEKRSGRTVKAVGKAARATALIGGAAVAGGMIYATRKAADFEQQMSNLGAVSDASARQMDRFRRQAIKAGQDTKFSAMEAAAAQTELAKGGLSVRQIMRGGLNSALALAAAGEMDLAEAAETTVNAMKLFGLAGPGLDEGRGRLGDGGEQDDRGRQRLRLLSQSRRFSGQSGRALVRGDHGGARGARGGRHPRLGRRYVDEGDADAARRTD